MTVNYEVWDFLQILYAMRNNKKKGIKFIILIGDGGVGKSTTFNYLCNLTPEQGSFVNDTDAKDGTTTFFGIYLPDSNVVYIDSPGVSFREEEWWQHIQQLSEVHGFIVMANIQGRNTGYKTLGYVYLQLQLNHPDKVKWYCVGNPRAMRTLSEDNYSYGKPHGDVLRDDPAAIDELRTWACGLRATEHLNVVNPTQLIGRFKALTIENGGLITRNETLSTADTAHAVAVGTLKRSHEISMKTLTDNHTTIITNTTSKIDKLRDVVDLLDEQVESSLMTKLPNGGIEPAGPGPWKHSYAWLPVAGSIVLTEHIQQMRDVLIAGEAAQDVTRMFREEFKKGSGWTGLGVESSVASDYDSESTSVDSSYDNVLNGSF